MDREGHHVVENRCCIVELDSMFVLVGCRFAIIPVDIHSINICTSVHIVKYGAWGGKETGLSSDLDQSLDPEPFPCFGVGKTSMRGTYMIGSLTGISLLPEVEFPSRVPEGEARLQAVL